mmetsp:Transcript_30616/g.44501  ORF Transcript_30616/g.44501 Transcript_30616/m.44501 type:complete len:303 (+) Transcript_30616:99-1007(+)
MVENKDYHSDDDDDESFSSSAIEKKDSAAATNTSTARCQSYPFQEGDHVYRWYSHLGMRYQHHGIVIEVMKNKEEDSKVKSKIIIVDFHLDYPEESADVSHDSSSASISDGILRNGSFGGSFSIKGQIAGPGKIRRVEVTEQADMNEWKKVEYGHENTNDGGDNTNGTTASTTVAIVTTTAASDPKHLVIARANFLLSNPSVLPDYDLLKSNCECVAVWCKTGKWCTLQGSSILDNAATSSVDMLKGVAPASLLPAISVFGVGASAALWYKKMQYEKFGEETADTLNKKFNDFLKKRSIQTK